MYQLWGGGAPFTKLPNGNLRDRKGNEVYLLGNSKQILETLGNAAIWENTLISYVSTCDEPEWAAECLHKFDLGIKIKIKIQYSSRSFLVKS